MKLLKAISVNKNRKILVQDYESKEWREFDSMIDALEFLGKEKEDEARTSKTAI